ncbi:MAG: type II toxin-antitoxin system Phd/YefM family antitoxin [Propionibacteriaceae bacterium]|nr:type II toxin-antitoxin system Phd/YefM family antitoxin [Micropruina sp.]HBX81273.1 type II toxin-antitoxin system prevent-host-death family antitoxin [Propionibacteriaceae bacterium]HBY22773.1 type II toxin-antitoxin system prevent-host-death family antitoxin [Propionibacteriaceae bacterium]
MTTISARDFSQDVSAAKRAAAHGPVVVTDRGEPAYVLLSIEDYRHLAATDCDAFLARLRMDDDIDVEFEPARIGAQVPKF